MTTDTNQPRTIAQMADAMQKLFAAWAATTSDRFRPIVEAATADAGRALDDMRARIAAIPPLAAEPAPVQGAGTDKPRCPRCGSARTVEVSTNGGATLRRQCVPCGRILPPPVQAVTAADGVLRRRCDPCGGSGERDGDLCPTCIGAGWWSEPTDPADPTGRARAVVAAVAPLLIEQGRRQALDEVHTWADDEANLFHRYPLDELVKKLAELRNPPLSCGCPPEHHDEAVRRLTDIMRRDGAITEES